MEKKDSLGSKLKKKSDAEENQYFAQRDRELVAKLKKEKEAEEEESLRKLALGRCPKCGDKLIIRLINEVEIDECPSCHGMWLDKGELEALSEQKGAHWAQQFVSGVSRALTGGRDSN